MNVTTEGAVVENVRITNGTIVVSARNVTLRNIDAVGARVQSRSTGLVVENAEFVPNGPTSARDPEVIGVGGYTLRNSVIDGYAEGARVGGKGSGAGPVRVENSYIRIVAPSSCTDWHGDGIQGYDGNALTVRNTTILLEERSGCGGTAPFFYPRNQGNTSVDIDGLIVKGGGYPFRNGMPGSIKNLNVVDGSWGYGPVEVNCPVLSTWQAQVVKLDSSGQPVPVRTLQCSGTGI